MQNASQGLLPEATHLVNYNEGMQLVAYLLLFENIV